MNRLCISFSGGETSAFMAQAILSSPIGRAYDSVKTVFANTGQENEQTLEFVRRCDVAFGLGVVWVEADVHPADRKAPTARVVNFNTASRKGEPFEAAIRKYGIPNQAFKHCTRTLKLAPITDYLRGCGWAPGSYDTAIGIRVDEVDRISAKAKTNRIVYPLVEWWPTTKPEVNTWWRLQPFRLQLKGYQGNCSWCWKKSLRKHLTLLRETPQIYDFPERMEREYAHVGPEFSGTRKTHQSALPQDYRRTFFRGGLSVADLRALLAERPDMANATDDAQEFSLFSPVYDVGAGCEETCEVFADEDAE